MLKSYDCWHRQRWIRTRSISGDTSLSASSKCSRFASIWRVSFMRYIGQTSPRIPSTLKSELRDPHRIGTILIENWWFWNRNNFTLQCFQKVPVLFAVVSDSWNVQKQHLFRETVGPVELVPHCSLKLRILMEQNGIIKMQMCCYVFGYGRDSQGGLNTEEHST